MGSNLRKGLFLVTITGAVTAFPYTVQASDRPAAEHDPAAGGDRGSFKRLLSVR